MSRELDRRLRALETAGRVDRIKYTVSDRPLSGGCAEGDDAGELCPLMTEEEWEAAFSFAPPALAPLFQARSRA